MTIPVTSTRVATKGAEALAGSNLKALRMKGSMDPDKEPNVTIPIREAAIVIAIRI